MRKIVGMLAGIILAGTTSSHATTFNAITATVVDPSQTANLVWAGPPAVNETVYASQIKLTGQINGVGAIIDQLVWCLDIQDGIHLPYSYDMAQYTAGDVRAGMQTLDALKVRQIASLMLNGLSVNGALASAATQLAIWKVEYGAALTLNNLGAGVQAAVDFNLLQSLIGGSLDCPNCVLTVLSDAPIVPSQAFGFVTQLVDPVPLPGAVWLFASGLAGLGMIARRRRKAAA